MAKQVEKPATPEQLAEIDGQATATAQRSIDKLGRGFRAAEAAEAKEPKAKKRKTGEG